MKLIFSIVEKAEQQQFFPDQTSVERILEGLCAVCRLSKPPQGWPELPYEEQIDKEDLQGAVERLREKGIETLGLKGRSSEI
jgi:hypothetical protein